MPPFGISAEQLLGVGELGPSPPTEQAVDREISLDVVNEEQIGVCQPQLPGRSLKARKKGTKGAKSVPSGSRNALFSFFGIVPNPCQLCGGCRKLQIDYLRIVLIHA